MSVVPSNIQLFEPPRKPAGVVSALLRQPGRKSGHDFHNLELSSNQTLTQP